MAQTYKKLISDPDFTQSLGEMVLAAGRLEGVLFDFLSQKGIQVGERAPLGRLIKKLESSGNLDDTVSYHLNFLLHERNYFVHRITQLMRGYEIEKSEIETFRKRVQSVREETEFFATMFLRSQSDKNTEQGAPADR
jgi:hypothetical protein